MEDLTDRQRQVLGFIRDYISAHSYPPTIREIQHFLGVRSTKGVKDHVDRLVDKGYLRRTDGAARAIELVDGGSGDSGTMVPVVGRVAAGRPLLATSDIEGYLPVSAGIARTPGMFFLRVSGASMEGAGILEDDMVLVRPQPFVEQGEIAVVMVEDEATVKRFYRRGDEVELRSENPAFPPMLYRDGSEVRVIGKVVALYREL